jgi:hypothetical protein
MECEGRTAEDSNRSLLPVLQQWQDPSSQCVRVCVRARKGPTVEVLSYALPYALPLQCSATFPGTFDIAPSTTCSVHRV